MTKKLFFLSLATILSCNTVKAQLSTNPDKFLGNITTSYNVDYGNEKFYTLWNQITCENESKWASVEGTNNQFNWGGADRAFNYANSHNFPFKFHALVWGSQYPSWIEDLTPAQRYNEIVQWMDKVKAHYPNLQLIDVVNEAVGSHQAGTKYFVEALGGTGVTGYDWIIKAFELAYERWPDAILIYNDFNTFRWDTDKYIDLVKSLRNAGAPIDAYGCQSHDLTDCSVSEFKSAMTKLQNALKMPMYSTEYDIGTSDDDKQLQRYKEQIPYMWESDYCAGITLWGYIYGKTWTTDGNSGIIRYNDDTKKYEDRPAMTWLREYMQTDAAKNAKSPFPGMVKEASVYVKPECINVEKGVETKINVLAKMRTKTIEKVDLYVKGSLLASMTQAPYEATYTPETTGAYELKAIVTCTDGTTYERYSGITAFNPRAPYKNTPTELPGILEAENFDSGAEGIAYHDTNSKMEGSGGSYRSDAGGVDIESGGSGYVLGYTQVGEWVEYTVNIKEAGIYAIKPNYSAPEAGAAFNISLKTDNGLVSLSEENVSVPTTNSWTSFKTSYLRTLIPLEAGVQTIRLTFTGGPSYVMNIDKFTFEHVTLDESMKITLTTEEDEAMTETEYPITANVTSTNEIKNVRFYVDGILTKTVTTYPYVFKYTPTLVGQYKVSAYITDVNGNQSAVATRNVKVGPKRGPYNGIKAVPGIIEAEDFNMGGDGVAFHDSDTEDQGKTGYRKDNEGVDIIKISGGGYAIGYTANDEWLDYTINVTEDATYKLDAIVSSASEGSTLKVGFVDGENVSYMRAIGVPVTTNGAYTTVTFKTSKTLTAGKYLIRLYISSGGCNIDKLIFRDANADAIDEISLDSEDDFRIYNLAGQQVGENYKGVIIRNGKKILKK